MVRDLQEEVASTSHVRKANQHQNRGDGDQPHRVAPGGNPLAGVARQYPVIGVGLQRLDHRKGGVEPQQQQRQEEARRQDGGPNALAGLRQALCEDDERQPLAGCSHLLHWPSLRLRQVSDDGEDDQASKQGEGRVADGNDDAIRQQLLILRIVEGGEGYACPGSRGQREDDLPRGQTPDLGHQQFRPARYEVVPQSVCRSVQTNAYYEEYRNHDDREDHGHVGRLARRVDSLDEAKHSDDVHKEDIEEEASVQSCTALSA
mmetsp:Transcript_59479/g.184520  ORF Transcript_59479/g.184520 Transcript_59479/m.184520 type:complete len:261 (-) Transcript_59479:329-1111(-)